MLLEKKQTHIQMLKKDLIVHYRKTELFACVSRETIIFPLFGV